MSLQDVFQTTSTEYRRADDLDFPVSKLRLFMDVLWQHVTGKPLTPEQKVTLKQLIDLLNLLDEHKHESEKELIAAMMPAIAPLLETMPTLGLTGTLVFTHLVPTYQHYLPVIERMVKDAHTFTNDEVFLYYELTIFDQLFLVHLFENERQLNLIEMIATIKAIILMNALVYDYHQHAKARSISFFTFLARGGMEEAAVKPFLMEMIASITDRTKQIVSNPACIEVMEFLKEQLIATTNESAVQPEAVPVQPTTEISVMSDTPATPTMTPPPVTMDPTPVPPQPVVETPVPVAPEPMPVEPVPAPVMPEPARVAPPVVENAPAVTPEPASTPVTMPTDTPTMPTTPQPTIQPEDTQPITASEPLVMEPVTSPVHTDLPPASVPPQPVVETPTPVAPPAPAVSVPVAAPMESAPQAPTFATTVQENPVG